MTFSFWCPPQGGGTATGIDLGGGEEFLLLCQKKKKLEKAEKSSN